MKKQTRGFTQIDNQPVRFLAKWVGDHATDTCSVSLLIRQPKAIAPLQLAPNPTTDHIRLSLPPGDYQVQVSTIAGQVVLRQYLPPAKSMDVSALPPGLYVVRIWDGEGKAYVGKFVRAR